MIADALVVQLREEAAPHGVDVLTWFRSHEWEAGMTARFSQAVCAAHDERHATAALIRSLIKLDARRLNRGEGYSSLITYCTRRCIRWVEILYGHPILRGPTNIFGAGDDFGKGLYSVPLPHRGMTADCRSYVTRKCTHLT